MSKTDKTTPFRVRDAQGVVEHNHSTGQCIIAPVGYQHRWDHARKCKHRVETVTYCTKQEPHRTEWGTQTCWHTKQNFITVTILGIEVQMVDPENPRTRIQCDGHTNVTWDHSLPCVCDTWPEKPTCFTREPYRLHKRRYREHGTGDLIDWATPKARRLATPKAERAAIAEGLADWYADREEERADYVTFEFDELAEWERELLREPYGVRLVPWDEQFTNDFKRDLEHALVTNWTRARIARNANQRRRIVRGY